MCRTWWINWDQDSLEVPPWSHFLSLVADSQLKTWFFAITIIEALCWRGGLLLPCIHQSWDSFEVFAKNLCLSKVWIWCAQTKNVISNKAYLTLANDIHFISTLRIKVVHYKADSGIEFREVSNFRFSHQYLGLFIYRFKWFNQTGPRSIPQSWHNILNLLCKGITSKVHFQSLI